MNSPILKNKYTLKKPMKLLFDKPTPTKIKSPPKKQFKKAVELVNKRAHSVLSW